LLVSLWVIVLSSGSADDENIITIELEKSFEAYSIHFTLEDKHSSSPLTIKNINNQEERIIYTVSANEPIDLCRSV